MRASATATATANMNNVPIEHKKISWLWNYTFIALASAVPFSKSPMSKIYIKLITYDANEFNKSACVKNTTRWNEEGEAYSKHISTYLEIYR